MNKIMIAEQLDAFTLREDIPQDVRASLEISADELRSPLETDKWIYRAVVVILGTVVIATVFGGILLAAFVTDGGQAATIPDAIIAIGSAAIGALAGLLAPSPNGK